MENIYFNLEHSHGRMFLQSLSQVEADLNKGLLRLECLCSEVASRLPCDSLGVEVLRLLVVDELLQELLVIVVHQVEEVAASLWRNVGSPDIVLVNTVHTQQHLLVLTPEHHCLTILYLRLEAR